MMDKFQLQKLRDLPIEGVAERLGLRVCRHKSLCPFHDDHHASLSFSVSRNTFRCWACGESGNTISLAEKMLGVSFLEACRWLANENNVILTEYKPSETKPAKPFDSSYYERFFLRPFLLPEARRFLFEERRLDPRVVRWCRLTSWCDKQGIPWLQIPYYNKEGKLVGVQNRNLQTPSDSPSRGRTTEDKSPLPHREGWGGSLPRFRFPTGSECSIYNLPILNTLSPGEALYIAEGCSDCWALLSAGQKAIAIPSATLLKKKDVDQLSIFNFQSSISLHMYPDRDEPGERLFLQLREILPDLEHHQLPPDCKDFSEMYLKTRT